MMAKPGFHTGTKLELNTYNEILTYKVTSYQIQTLTHLTIDSLNDATAHPRFGNTMPFMVQNWGKIFQKHSELMEKTLPVMYLLMKIYSILTFFVCRKVIANYLRIYINLKNTHDTHSRTSEHYWVLKKERNYPEQSTARSEYDKIQSVFAVFESLGEITSKLLVNT